MERIDAREGETTRFGGFTIAWAKARGGHLIGLVNSGEGETAEDVKAAAAKIRKRLTAAAEIATIKPTR